LIVIVATSNIVPFTLTRPDSPGASETAGDDISLILLARESAYDEENQGGKEIEEDLSKWGWGWGGDGFEEDEDEDG
ncbi:hypothetical protein H0H93_013428, partial [Arthromyces matolae]